MPSCGRWRSAAPGRRRSSTAFGTTADAWPVTSTATTCSLLAAQAVRDGPRRRPTDLGPVVLHLPRRLGRADLAWSEALAARTEVVAVLGVTGDADGDRPLRRLLEQLEPVSWAPRRRVDDRARRCPGPGGPRARILRRKPVKPCASCWPGWRPIPSTSTGSRIVSRVASPYRLLLHEHLETAGLPHHVGPAVVGGPEHAGPGPARSAGPAGARVPTSRRGPVAAGGSDPVAGPCRSRCSLGRGRPSGRRRPGPRPVA